MNIKGTIKRVLETERVSDKFAKRDFVLTFADNPLYPQDIQFQVTQDRCALLDKVKAGDAVDVEFNIRGREWVSPQGEVKYFNTLEAWRIKVEGSGAPVARTLPPVDTSRDDDDLDLPF